MHKVQKQHLAEPDLLTRLWIVSSHQFGILHKNNVEFGITNTGFTFKGLEKDILESMSTVMDLQKKYKSKGISTKEQLEKLSHISNKVDIIQIRKLKGNHQQQMKELDKNINFILVYDKTYQIQILECLQELLNQALEITPEDTLKLCFMGFFQRSQEKFSCFCKINEINSKLILQIKGNQDKIKEMIKCIKNTLKKYKTQILICDKNKNFNKLEIPLLKSKFREWKLYAFDREKVAKKTEHYKFQSIFSYLKMIETKYGNYIGFLFQNNKMQQVQNLVVRAFKEICVKTRQISTFNEQTTHKIAKKTTKRVEFVEFPISKMIYLGFHKFQNFKKKIGDIQQSFNISIQPSIVQQQNQVRYVLYFNKTTDETKIYQDLKFFFNSFKIRTMEVSLNGAINFGEVKRSIIREVDQSQLLKDFIIDDIEFKNMFLSFSLFSGKNHNLNIEKKIQKMLSNLTNQHTRLIQRKDQKY